jgi:hypothetical protein
MLGEGLKQAKGVELYSVGDSEMAILGCAWSVG